MIKHSWLLPPFVLGCLAAWIVRSLLDQPSLRVDTVFTGSITFAVGWWIQRTLRRQAELDRVPIDAVGKLTGRLDDLIVQCLNAAASGDPKGAELLQSLRALSNEITWLGTVVETLGIDAGLHAGLVERYRSFKIRLTGSKSVALSQAAEIGRKMRSDCLRMRWNLCRHILDSPEDFLGSSVQSDPSAS